MKRIIMLGMVLVIMLVSLGGCYLGYDGYGRGGGHDRGEGRDKDEGHDRGEGHDGGGGHEERR